MFRVGAQNLGKVRKPETHIYLFGLMTIDVDKNSDYDDLLPFLKSNYRVTDLN